jgi:hypothetical protein
MIYRVIEGSERTVKNIGTMDEVGSETVSAITLDRGVGRGNEFEQDIEKGALS